jgi:SAM-dependent methyltransferase
MDEAPKPFVLEVADRLPESGRALDIACGEGQLAVWLARRGLDVTAVDVSACGLEKLARRARAQGVAARVRAVRHDLDRGLPPLDGQFDLITCVDFHAPALMPATRALLAPGGVLLVQVLLAAEGHTGAFRARPGAVLAFAGELEVLVHRESPGGERPAAQLLARRPGGTRPSWTGAVTQGQNQAPPLLTRH